MEAFITESVVPDALEAPPQAVMKMSFAGVDVAPGDIVTPTQAADAPTLSWPAEEGALYTVTIFALDVPSRMDRSQSEVCCWLVDNVPGDDISKGKVTLPYMPPHPAKDTGMHRLLAVAFKQSGPVDSSDIDSTTDGFKPRSCRSVRKLSDKWQLGAPCAGTFFITEYAS